MASKVPSVLLNNGTKIPIIGLGTWKSKPGEVTQAVKDAIDCGYRHFDCAHLYQNEKEVGEALSAKISEGVVTRDQLFITSKAEQNQVIEAVKEAIDVGYRHFDCAHIYRNEKEVGEALKVKLDQGVVKREDLFITSKLWNTFHKRELVEPALRMSLSNLGLDYLDLYLIHWPYAFKEGGDLVPKDDNKKILFSDTHFTETWKAMEECVKAGLTKSIGVSNFNSEQIKQILDIATIKPVTNQVECHVYLNQSRLLEYCKPLGITLTAYGPLGSPDRPPETSLDAPIRDTTVAAIAAKYDKTPAQILIKFQVERGVIVIPKSVTKSRIQSNFEVFDFDISPEDMEKLEALDCNGRFFLVKGNADHKDYPFNIDF